MLILCHAPEHRHEPLRGPRRRGYAADVGARQAAYDDVEVEDLGVPAGREVVLVDRMQRAGGEAAVDDRIVDKAELRLNVERQNETARTRRRRLQTCGRAVCCRE